MEGSRLKVYVGSTPMVAAHNRQNYGSVVLSGFPYANATFHHASSCCPLILN